MAIQPQDRIYPLHQFPLCKFPLRQFPLLFGQCWQSGNMTKWELTKCEVDKVGIDKYIKIMSCCLCELDVGMWLTVWQWCWEPLKPAAIERWLEVFRQIDSCFITPIGYHTVLTSPVTDALKKIPKLTKKSLRTYCKNNYRDICNPPLPRARFQKTLRCWRGIELVGMYTTWGIAPLTMRYSSTHDGRMLKWL